MDIASVSRQTALENTPGKGEDLLGTALAQHWCPTLSGIASVGSRHRLFPCLLQSRSCQSEQTSCCSQMTLLVAVTCSRHFHWYLKMRSLENDVDFLPKQAVVEPTVEGGIGRWQHCHVGGARDQGLSVGDMCLESGLKNAHHAMRRATKAYRDRACAKASSLWGAVAPFWCLTRTKE